MNQVVINQKASMQREVRMLVYVCLDVSTKASKVGGSAVDSEL